MTYLMKSRTGAKYNVVMGDARSILHVDMDAFFAAIEQRDHPDFVAAVQQVVETAERHGVAGGAHFSVEAHTRRLIEQGGRFIPFSSDMRMIQGGTADLVNRIRTRETVAT